MYESRVRGISPAEATDSLIKLAWIRAAAERYHDTLKEGGRPAMGVDVANSEKGDKGSRAYGVGPCLVEVVSKPCPNANLLGAEVFREANEQGIDPSHIGVDPVGVGAGTVNELVRLGMEPRRLGGSLAPINGAQRSPDGSSMDFAPDANLFLNLRSQMAWQLREDFRAGTIAMNPELVARLAGQLTAPRYEKRGGKIVLEEKKEIKKRLGRSPDDFDSIMYWNWVRPRSRDPIVVEYADDQHPGYDYQRKQRKPRRDRRMVPDHAERSGYYRAPVSWRAPRWDGSPSEDGDA